MYAHEFNLIDGGVASVTFSPPTQTACLSYQGTIALHGGISDDASTAEKMEAFSASYRVALDFLDRHSDKGREWFDVNVTAVDTVRAAQELLASRAPAERVVGKSESSPES